MKEPSRFTSSTQLHTLTRPMFTQLLLVTRMMRFLLCVLALLVTQVTAFQPSSVHRNSRSLTMAEKSKSLPFLDKPAALDGSLPVRESI